MTINITGQNVDLSEDLKSYAQEKILKFAPLVLEPAICDIVLTDEYGPKGGKDKSVHLTLTLPGEKNSIHLEVLTDDFFGSIDLIQEKLDRELEKYKAKIKIGDRHSED